VAIFAFSAFIAGCAGSLHGGLVNTADQVQFEPVLGLVILLYAFVGGITTVTGAVLAGSLFALLSYAQSTFPDLAGLVFLAIAAGAIGLGRQPDGIAGVVLGAFGRRDRGAGGALDRLRHRNGRPATAVAAGPVTAEGGGTA
jgi:branched-chain amino acid transport system permease protein